MKKLSKNYKKAIEKLWEKRTDLSISDAVSAVLLTSTTKFDSTIELHVNLNIDVKQADQMVRWTVILPHWTWKKIRVAAFITEDKKKKAIDAWADIAWVEFLVDEVLKWNINFDVAVATPDTMKDLWKIAKILGPKWLMPSPKAWTVTQDFEATIKDLKKWKVEYKADKTWITHNWIWKVSFGKDKIIDNLKKILSAIIDARPVAVKSNYILSIALATTMWPSVTIDKNSVINECK